MTGDIAATISKAREHSIGDLLRRSAQREPNKPALGCGQVRWTFAELEAVCNRLARGLLGFGVRKGDRVAVLSRNSHAFAALRFAVARIGDARIERILRRAGWPLERLSEPQPLGQSMALAGLLHDSHQALHQRHR